MLRVAQGLVRPEPCQWAGPRLCRDGKMPGKLVHRECAAALAYQCPCLNCDVLKSIWRAITITSVVRIARIGIQRHFSHHTMTICVYA
jgi:hypothetical protein